MNDIYPFLLRPAVKDYLWGGTRLRDDFCKTSNCNPLAETWECSTHPSGESRVATGQFAGQTLTEVLKTHPGFVGTHPHTVDGQLPILIKFIDAKQDLSVQVHPSDAYALEHENGELGKTEMWYVVDATPDATLVYGLAEDTTRDALHESIRSGRLMEKLHVVPVRKNDVFYIPAGTIHAIGGGALIAEIQQNSNLTYRLYDYGRKDKNGNERELHVEKALDVANLKSTMALRQPMRLLRYRRGFASELLCRCNYFQVERVLINTESNRTLVDFATDENSFKVLLCLKGCGCISKGSDFSLNFFKGDCIFVPANVSGLKLHGKAQLLSVNA